MSNLLDTHLPDKIRATDLFEFMTDKESEEFDDEHLLSCDTSQENDLRLMEEMAKRYNAYDRLLEALSVAAKGLDLLSTDFDVLAEDDPVRTDAEARSYARKSKASATNMAAAARMTLKAMRR